MKEALGGNKDRFGVQASLRMLLLCETGLAHRKKYLKKVNPKEFTLNLVIRDFGVSWGSQVKGLCVRPNLLICLNWVFADCLRCYIRGFAEIKQRRKLKASTPGCILSFKLVLNSENANNCPLSCISLC